VIPSLFCDAFINGKSLILKPYSTGHGITFTFDSTYDCMIGIFFCASETTKPGSPIEYFTSYHKDLLHLLDIPSPKPLHLGREIDKHSLRICM